LSQFLKSRAKLHGAKEARFLQNIYSQSTPWRIIFHSQCFSWENKTLLLSHKGNNGQTWHITHGM
jgi:hypothetical protein